MGTNNRTAWRLVVISLLFFWTRTSQPEEGITFRNADSPATISTWAAPWIAASWSTERDGAEADGSRPMPIFRREFAVRAQPAVAILRIAGLGQWQATLDGRPLIAKPGLHQAWTDYGKRVTFMTLDLTTSLVSGRHVLGVTLGNGMYNVQHTRGRYTKFEGSFGVPKLTAELAFRYRDGSTEIVPTDAVWQVARGPVTFSSAYGGEDFDARRVQAGWDRPGFMGTEWQPAQVVEGPAGEVEPATAPDVIRIASFHSARRTEPVQGRMVYDFGQNMAGIPRVRVQGIAGAVLRLTPGELLNSDGTVNQTSSGKGMWWSYTLRGDSKGETWEPEFGYYGFRYLQAEWVLPKDTVPLPPPKLMEVIVDELSSDSPATGSFSSSSELLNSIHHLIVAAMHNNEVSLFTDCPHREKLGWLEETHLVASGLLFNNDLEALFRETDRNIAEAQGANGMVPTIAPQYTKFGPKYPIYDDSPEWGAATVLAPWAAFRFYGDPTELERSYPTMQAWMHYLEARAQDGIVAYGLGDWYDIGPGDPGFEKNTTLGVTGTLMLYECARAMEQIARRLNRRDDAAAYATLAAKTASAFNRRFWDEEHRWYDRGSQTANAMPLALGLVPSARRADVLKRIIDDVRAHDDHVTTGEVGYPYLLRALMQAGRSDVVLAMLLRKDPPSYGAQLAAGATSLTEAWDANPKNSQDHLMLGDAEEWFYRALGGIDLDLSRADTVQRLILRPEAVDGVDWVRCSYRSKLGMIESDWRREPGAIAFTVTVPQGVEATLMLPGRLQSAKPAGASAAPMVTGRQVFHVKAGVWRFRMVL